MSTATSIVRDALKKIGADSIAKPAHPETISHGRTVLNSMLQEWLSRGIDLNIVPIDLPGEEVGEPIDARNAIVLNLALLLAPDFDNGKDTVSPTLKSQASIAMTNVENQYQNFDIPNKIVSSTLPQGQGNERDNINRRTFFGENQEIDN